MDLWKANATNPTAPYLFRVDPKSHIYFFASQRDSVCPLVQQRMGPSYLFIFCIEVYVDFIVDFGNPSQRFVDFYLRPLSSPSSSSTRQSWRSHARVETGRGERGGGEGPWMDPTRGGSSSRNRGVLVGTRLFRLTHNAQMVSVKYGEFASPQPSTRCDSNCIPRFLKTVPPPIVSP